MTEKRQKQIDESLSRSRDLSKKVSQFLAVQNSAEWQWLVAELKTAILQDSLRVVALHGEGKHDEARLLAAELAARQWLVDFPTTHVKVAEVQLQNFDRYLKGLK